MVMILMVASCVGCENEKHDRDSDRSSSYDWDNDYDYDVPDIEIPDDLEIEITEDEYDEDEDEDEYEYSGVTVYVSRTGKIHSNRSCSGMKYYTRMDYNEAVDEGYDFCMNCY